MCGWVGGGGIGLEWLVDCNGWKWLEVHRVCESFSQTFTRLELFAGALKTWKRNIQCFQGSPSWQVEGVG